MVHPIKKKRPENLAESPRPHLLHPGICGGWRAVVRDHRQDLTSRCLMHVAMPLVSFGSCGMVVYSLNACAKIRLLGGFCRCQQPCVLTSIAGKNLLSIEMPKQLINSRQRIGR